MNYREKILKTLRRENEELLFLPRLDIWYRYQEFHGLLGDFEGMSYAEVLKEMGFGYHHFISDFDCETDHMHEALGLYSFKSYPFQYHFKGIEMKSELKEGSLRNTYKTPYGTIETISDLSSMKSSGATQISIEKYALSGPEDLDPLIYLFSQIEVTSDPDGLYELIKEVGEEGLVIPLHASAASGMHFILRCLAPLDQFYYLLTDEEEKMNELASRIQKILDVQFDLLCEMEVEAMMTSLNVSSVTTPPSFFEKYILNDLIRYAKKAKANHKLLCIHPDGENYGLLDYYLQSGVDVFDSICPFPMTQISFEEYYERLSSVSYTGIIPSNLVVESCTSEVLFKEKIDEIFRQIKNPRGLLLSIADTTPPNASLGRLQYIKRKTDEYNQKLKSRL